MTPDVHTIQELHIDVGDGHQLYVQEWGNKTARQPIVVLHGGPGGSCNNDYKTNFDPRQQRVIFFDQRGCGKSLPYGSLEHNTTENLVEDIEKIAQELKLETFIVTGGSWGSCLALAYALKYPHRVAGMLIRGIFTGTEKEINWLDKGQFTHFFPDVWQTYLENTPQEHQADPSAYHFARALGADPIAAKESAYAYENVEGALLALDDRYTPRDFETYDPSKIIIEIHYLVNRCFMSDNYILNNAHKLPMPVWIIQGRYDMVCPPVTATKLHQALPNSHYVPVIAGHAHERVVFDLSRSLLLQLSQAV